MTPLRAEELLFRGLAHAGQISLPGGAREGAEPYEACAKRELLEELGVEPASVRIVASLSVLEIVSSRFVVRPEASVVAGVYEPTISAVIDPRCRQEYDMAFDGKTYRVPYFNLCGQLVWGATAMMLAELGAMLGD